ncbi:MAG: hypothetical protein JWQ03_3231 [Variovorax sp.]|nr:hypothetical protein [Variovorax sp.]
MPISFLLDADTAKLEQAMGRAKDIVAQQTSTMLSSVEQATSGMVRAFGESSTALEALASSSGGLGSLDAFEAKLYSFGINVEGAAKTAQFGLGALALGLKGFSVQEIANSIISANKELGDLARTAKLVGASTDDIQKFQYAMKTLGGIDSAQSLKASLDLYAKANAEFRETQAGGSGGNITKLFQANGLSLSNANGELKDFNSLMEDVSRLITNAKTEIDKIRIAQLLGVTQDWITALEKGPAAIRASEAAAKSAGAVIDENLVKKAAEFDRRWNQTFSYLSSRAKEVGIEIADFLFGADDPAKLKSQVDNLVRRRTNIITEIGGNETHLDKAIEVTQQQLQDKTREQLVKNMAATPEGDTSQRPSMPGTVQGEFGALTFAGKTSADIQKENEQQQKLSELRINKLATNQATVIPSTAKDTAPSEDEVERYIKQLEKTVDVTQAQVRVQGLGNAERAKAVDLARAEAAARERGSALTDEEREKIDRLAQAHADATKALENYKKQQQAVADATNFFGQQAIDVFDQMIFQGAKASDVFKSLAQTIVKAALQAELLGSGPLAGMFGTTGQNGGVGGLLGALTKSFGGFFGSGSGDAGSLINPIAGARAEGGPVMAGGTYLVGEKGPELLRMASDGMVIPNASSGGGASPISVVINNTSGAQIETQQGRGPDGRQQLQIAVQSAIMDDFRSRGPVSREMEKRGLRR